MCPGGQLHWYVDPTTSHNPPFSHGSLAWFENQNYLNIKLKYNSKIEIWWIIVTLSRIEMNCELKWNSLWWCENCNILSDHDLEQGVISQFLPEL